MQSPHQLTVRRFDAASASLLLATLHGDQRRLHPEVARRYAQAMLDGRWRSDNPEAIKIAKDGTLMDGQHRLQAVIYANEERPGFVIRLAVIEDVAPDLFSVLDTGLRRAAHQWLGSKTASAVKLCIWYERYFPLRPSGPTFQYDNDVMFGWFEALGDRKSAFEELVAWASQVQRASRVPQAILVTIGWHISEVDQDRFASFMEGLRTGADLPLGDPRLALRQRTLDPLMSARTTSRMWVVVVRTWNTYRSGGSLRIVKDMGSKGAMPKVSEGGSAARFRKHKALTPSVSRVSTPMAASD